MDVCMETSKALQKFGKFLSQLAERSEHVYWLSSADFRKIQYISPAYEKIWGRKLDELYFHPEEWIKFLHPEDAQHHNPILVMKERIERFGFNARYEEDYRIIRPTGEVRWIMDRGFPIYDDNGVCIGVTGVALDVTKEKLAEVALAKAKESAEEANRVKTEFLANMSHDVKTPLTGVIGMAELMSHDTSLAEKDRKNAEAIYACGKQLLSFFNNCLDLSKMEMSEWSTTIKTFSLKELLNDISALFIPTATNKKLFFKVECDHRLPPVVQGHYDSAYHVILNLIGNALKFTERGGVTVRAFLQQENLGTGINVGLEVKDTGAGIPQDQQKVIFEKLRRLTPSYKSNKEGHGIGLYIVDQYVKRMGGSITVTSEVGRGSTFLVILPMQVGIAQRSENILPVKKEVVLAEKNSAKILLVEDNPMVQHITKLMLQECGFVVDVATTGKEAIEKETKEKYKLIFMDIGLPDTDGYVVTKKIRMSNRSTPIIALTAHGALDVKQMCEEVGMQEIFSKPINKEQVENLWKKYSKGKKEISVVDMQATIDLVGAQAKAEEMLRLWNQRLNNHFLPELKQAVQENNLEKLRQELHSMLGSLCYVKMPMLNQAVLEFQHIVKHHPEDISIAYQNVLKEVKRVKKVMVDMYSYL